MTMTAYKKGGKKEIRFKWWKLNVSRFQYVFIYCSTMSENLHIKHFGKRISHDMEEKKILQHKSEMKFLLILIHFLFKFPLPKNLKAIGAFSPVRFLIYMLNATYHENFIERRLFIRFHDSFMHKIDKHTSFRKSYSIMGDSLDTFIVFIFIYLFHFGFSFFFIKQQINVYFLKMSLFLLTKHKTKFSIEVFKNGI